MHVVTLAPGIRAVEATASFWDLASLLTILCKVAYARRQPLSSGDFISIWAPLKDSTERPVSHSYFIGQVFKKQTLQRQFYVTFSNHEDHMK